MILVPGLVVDAKTGNFLGVLISGSSMLQEGYVIPSDEIIRDIRSTTNAADISLPTRQDSIRLAIHFGRQRPRPTMIGPPGQPSYGGPIGNNDLLASSILGSDYERTMSRICCSNQKLGDQTTERKQWPIHRWEKSWEMLSNDGELPDRERFVYSILHEHLTDTR